jgi:amino acid permease
MSTMIGIGDLTLPYAISQSGLAVGIVFIITGILLTIWSFSCLTSVAFKRGISKYSDLVYDVLGRRAGNVFQYIMILYLLGGLSNFQINSAHFIQGVLGNIIGVSPTDINSSWEWPVQIAIVNVILFWIARAKTLNALRHITLVIVGVIVYITLVVVFQAPSYFKENFKSEDLVIVNWNPNLLSTFAVVAFAFTGQYALLPVRAELSKPAEYRMKKIIRRSVMGVGIIYLTLGVVGYLSLLTLTTQVIPDRPAIGTTNIMMNIAQCFLCFSVSFGIAIRVNPAKLQLHTLFKTNPDSRWNDIFTILLLSFTGFIAVKFPHVYAAITITGGYGSALLAYLFPGLIYIKSAEKKWTFRVIGSAIITVIATLMGVIPATLTVLSSCGIIDASYS